MPNEEMNLSRNTQLAEPCVEHLAVLRVRTYTAAELGRMGLTEVGTIGGVYLPDGTPVEWEQGGREIPMLGIGAYNSFNPQEVALARRLLFGIFEKAAPGTVTASYFNGAASPNFQDFASLGRLFDQSPSPQKEGLVELLDELWKYQVSVANGARRVGTHLSPHRIGLLVGNGQPLPPEANELLAKIHKAMVNTDAVSLITVNLPGGSPGIPEGLVVRPHDTPPEQVRRLGETVLEAAKKGDRPPALETVIPQVGEKELLTGSAVQGIEAALGTDENGRPVRVTFTGANSHGIILAPTGTGKTTLLREMLTDWNVHLSPDELRLYIADGKQADFATLAPDSTQGRPEWQIHTAALGMNINNDPDMAMAIFKRVQSSLDDRAALFRRSGVTNYEEYRRRHPEAVLPREMLLVDEFQVFLSGARGEEVAAIFEDIVRRGRSAGVHLVLASQDMKSVRTLWTGTGTVLERNMGVKISASGNVFSQDTDSSKASKTLPPMHMTVTTAEGEERIVRIPAAFEDAARPYRQQAWKVWLSRNPKARPPRVLDGEAVPPLYASPAYRQLKEKKPPIPEVFVGERAASLEDKPGTFPLDRSHGRNLAVITPNTDVAGRVMETAAASLGVQLPPDQSRFTILCLDDRMTPAARAAASRLAGEGHSPQIITEPHEAAALLKKVRQSLEDGTSKGRHLLFVYGGEGGGSAMNKKQRHDLGPAEGFTLTANASPFAPTEAGTPVAYNSKDPSKKIPAPARGTVERVYRDGRERLRLVEADTGQDHLARIIVEGPQDGVHVIATWQNEATLKGTVGEEGQDAFRGHVAAAIHPAQLTKMTPGYNPVEKQLPDRPNRARFYDQQQHRAPETIIPYEVTSP